MKSLAVAITAIVVLSGTGICQSEAKRRPQDPSPEDLARIRAAVPNKATAQPARARKMLVLSYQSHERGRFAGEKMLATMAEKTGAFEMTLVEDKETMAQIMVPEKLKAFDAVCVNNSTGGEGYAVNGKTLVENLSDYVAGGGGLIGIHAATDNKMGEVFGGFFSRHPWRERDPAVGIKIDDPDHTLTKVFDGEGFMVNDEIYQFTQIYSREKLRILLSLDMTKTEKKGQREDDDYAVAWVRAHGKGRVFYCSLGHRPQIFQDPKLVQFYLDGIQFALGDIKADMTPSGPLPKIVERQFRRLSVAQYRDKMKGAWLGQMIGVGWGESTEFKFKCIIPEDMMPQWKPEMINGFNQDDIYVEMTFMGTLEQYGMDVSIRQAGIDFARSGYRLWHANDEGRNNLRKGIAPPDSGHPKFNRHADDIDYQIEADYSGIIAPGLPNTAIELGEKFGRLMNYGDGLYGGQFVGGMYTEAYFESDPWKIVEAGLKCIPPESQYAEMVRDLLRWCKENDDWTKTWQLVEDKYHKDPNYTHGLCSQPGAGNPDPKLQVPGSTRGGGSIDAKLNGAYVIMGLLYGQSDLDKTIVTSCRCGQDSDCNPSTAGGVLSTMIGASKIPSRFTEKLDLTAKFSYSDLTLAQVYDLSEKLARQAVIRAGGRIEKDAKGEEYFLIPLQTPKPSASERSWQPGPIANSRFTDEEMARIKGDAGVSGVGRQFPPE